VKKKTRHKVLREKSIKSLFLVLWNEKYITIRNKYPFLSVIVHTNAHLSSLFSLLSSLISVLSSISSLFYLLSSLFSVLSSPSSNLRILCHNNTLRFLTIRNYFTPTTGFNIARFCDPGASHRHYRI